MIDKVAGVLINALTVILTFTAAGLIIYKAVKWG